MFTTNFVNTTVESNKNLVELMICKDKSVLCITGYLIHARTSQCLIENLNIHNFGDSNRCKKGGMVLLNFQSNLLLNYSLQILLAGKKLSLYIDEIINMVPGKMPPGKKPPGNITPRVKIL